MSLFEQMKEIKVLVKHILEKHPHLRDNDYRLVATFLLYEGGGRESMDKMTASEFLQQYADGKYTNFESIRRVRQKLQEEFPELRGEKWIQRKKKGNNYNKEGL